MIFNKHMHYKSCHIRTQFSLLSEMLIARATHCSRTAAIFRIIKHHVENSIYSNSHVAYDVIQNTRQALHTINLVILDQSNSTMPLLGKKVDPKEQVSTVLETYAV